MPISDNYVIQYLLEATRCSDAGILWEETESERYVASINSIRAEFEHVPTRTGSRLYITLSCAKQRVHIAEPQNIGFFRAKYRTEDGQRLAQLMRELDEAITRQCAARSRANAEASDVIREAMYKRLIGAAAES